MIQWQTLLSVASLKLPVEAASVDAAVKEVEDMDTALVAAKDMVDEVADCLRPHISASRATQKA